MYGNSDIVFVLYNNMDYVVFNYRNGNVLKQSINSNKDLVSYFTSYITNTSTSNKNSKNYKDSLNLISKIKRKGISDVLEEDNENNSIVVDSYTSIYNPVTEKYEVYNVPNMDIDGDSDITLDEVLNDTSTSNIIDNNLVLYNYYIGTDIRNRKILLSVLAIVSTIFIGIGLSIILLKKNILKK